MMRISVFLVLIFSIVGCQSVPKLNLESGPARWSVLQGATSDTVTHVTVLVETTHIPNIQLLDESSGVAIAPASASTETRAPNPWGILRLRFEKLKPGAEYRLAIASQDGKTVDKRHLKTLKSTSTEAKFALISCMNDWEADVQRVMWPAVFARRPDILFLIGDNVYADLKEGRRHPADPEQIWSRYVETRRALSLYYFDDLIPTIAAWDDHDTGKNDADKTFPHIEEAALVFRAFFAQDPIPGWLTAGPGLSAEFNYAGQSFYFLDNRLFRSPNLNRRPGAEPPPPEAVADQAHFGPEQEAWLFTALKAGRQPTWLISGDQFYGGYHPFESYQGSHPRAFREFIAGVAKSKRPVIFASGDRHLTEIIQVPITELGYPTYELTSSPIHAKLFPSPLREHPSPNQLVGKDETYNYMIVTSRVGAKGDLSARVVSYAPGDEVVFEREIGVRR